MPSKYRNVKTVVDGVRFDSKREAAAYVKLSCLQKAGHIKDLQLQVPYKIVVCGVFVCTYRADFVYYDVQRRCTVVADAKGVRTKEYVLKKKLMLAVHGISIFEI